MTLIIWTRFLWIFTFVPLGTEDIFRFLQNIVVCFYYLTKGAHDAEIRKCALS